MITQEKIREVAQKIAREFKPEKIILFGSYAWGTPGPDSDLDLFIVKEAENTREEAGNVRGFLWGSKIPMDILIYTPKSVNNSINKGNFFIKNIVSEGKVLYER